MRAKIRIRIQVQTRIQTSKIMPHVVLGQCEGLVLQRPSPRFIGGSVGVAVRRKPRVMGANAFSTSSRAKVWRIVGGYGIVTHGRQKRGVR